MRRTAIIAAVTVAAAVATMAAAAAQSARLTAAEARAELFGVELFGVNEAAGDSWSECIEPSGRTLYRRGAYVDEGRLEIAEDGRACFSYLRSGFRDGSCFEVLREGENYRFDSFVTRAVRRGVRRCGVSGDAAV